MTAWRFSASCPVHGKPLTPVVESQPRDGGMSTIAIARCPHIGCAPWEIRVQLITTGRTKEPM